MTAARPSRPIARIALTAACMLLAHGGAARGHVDETAPTIHDALTGARPDALTYLQHVTTLANPFFEGRGTGTEGNERAQDYIEFHFERLGLKPAFDKVLTLEDGTEVVQPNASFRQPFPFASTAEVTTEQVVVEDREGERLVFTPGQDFNVLGFSGAAEIRAPIAFVGYSIEDGPDGYTSYPNDEDLSGKIALLLRFEPIDEEGRSAFTGNGWSGHAGLMNKIGQAVDRNAAAIILVNPPGADDRGGGPAPAARRLTEAHGGGPSQARRRRRRGRDRLGRRSRLHQRRH